MLSKTELITYYRHNKAFPFKLPANKQNLSLALELVRIFESSRNKHRYEIDAEIKKLSGAKTNSKVIMGLAKILTQHSTFSSWATEDPFILRERIFSAAAEYWKRQSQPKKDFREHKNSILSGLGYHQPKIIRQTDSWLYGDIADNQVLDEFDSLTPLELIDRYNIEQVRGTLINATSLELNITVDQEATFRQVLRMLKFFGLMFQVTSHQGRKLIIQIDGTASILENSKAYGIEIANLFPAILLLKKSWTMTANINRLQHKKHFILEISSENDYKTYYRSQGIWHQEVLLRLIERFNEKYSNAQAIIEKKVVPLKRNRYLLPDIILKKNPGKEIFVEWLPYLSSFKLQWLKSVFAELPENYYFVVKGKKDALVKLPEACRERLFTYRKDLTAPLLMRVLLQNKTPSN